MKLSMLFAAGLLLAAVPGFADVASICDSDPNNLVTNCGFENGDLTGWSPVNQGFSYVTTGSQNSGTYYLAIGTSGSDMEISQTFNDVAGQQYLFTFYYSPSGWTPQDFTAQFNGTNLLTVLNDTVPGPYARYAYTVTGTGNDTIAFFGRNDNSYDYLDDVYFGVPEPSPIWFVASMFGAAAFWKLWRRSAEKRAE